MFDLALPWWELAARAAIVYFALLVMVRVSGKRTVGQFTAFDLLVVMLLSEGVSNGLTGGDASLLGGLIIAATLIAVNLLVAFATARSQKMQRIVEGRPILIGRDGEIFRDKLQGQHVAVSDLEQALREADCDLANMRCAFLEADGRISILQKKD